MSAKHNYIIIYLILLGVAFSSCSRPQKFTREAWSYADDLNFPSRDKIVDDLLANHPLKGLTHYQILQLIGLPQDMDTAKFMYTYEIENTGYHYNPKKKPVHIKNLLVYFNKDSVVTEAKIFEITKNVK